MSGPQALGKPKICPFITSANPTNRCHECKLGIRVMSEAKQAEHQRHGRNVAQHTHDCTLQVLAGKFAGPMVAALEGVANVTEGHIQAIEKHLTESIEAQVGEAVKKAVVSEMKKATKKASSAK